MINYRKYHSFIYCFFALAIQGSSYAQYPSLQIQPLQLQNPIIQFQQIENIRAMQAQRQFYEEQLRQQQLIEQREQRELQLKNQQREEKEKADLIIFNWIKASSPRGQLFPDFEKVVFASDVPITTEMILVMTASKFPADLAYYFGVNKEDAFRVSKLSKVEMIEAMNIIADQNKFENNEYLKNINNTNPAIGNVYSKISQSSSKRIALVIGNASYPSSPLKNPVNDAADISAVLKRSGFEVIDQRNATLVEMTRAIRQFGDKLMQSDVGLVYFSGHGIEAKGRNYLLPVNANLQREDEVAFQAIDANMILEKMNTANKSVNILIVDACRDNPFARSFRSISKGLAQMDAPTGTIVAFSTSPGKTAADGNGRNSPFTKNLVKAMSKINTPIETVFKEVRKLVVEETKGQQTPWESSSLIGDFYFKVANQ
jgi:hypothetical protein